MYPAPANPTAAVPITANKTFPLCKGTSVTFAAAPVNGGATPAYQWKKNGVNAGTNTAAWTTTGLNNSDVITCVMTSSIAGALNNPATSNAITANILSAPSVPVVTPAGPTTYCSGKNQCTLSTVAVAGSSYQWYKGTTVINGATSNTYTPTATSSNTYKVAITNSVGCSKTSTTTAITVNANPASTITTQQLRTVREPMPVHSLRMPAPVTPINGTKVLLSSAELTAVSYVAQCYVQQNV